MAVHSKKILKKVLFKIATLILLFAAADTWGSDDYLIGIVTATEVAVQSEPGSPGLSQKILKRGARIKIVERRGGWLKILHNEEPGFIRDQAHRVKIVQSKKAETDKGQSRPPGDPQSQIDAFKKRKVHISREIEKGRPEEEIGAHVGGYNKNSIGVCWVGGKERDLGLPIDNRTAKQRDSLSSLIYALKAKYPEAEILGHRDFPGVTKQCPCFNVKEEY